MELPVPPGALTLRWWRRTLRLLWLFMHRQVLGVLSWRGFMVTLAIQQTVPPPCWGWRCGQTCCPGSGR